MRASTQQASPRLHAIVFAGVMLVLPWGMAVGARDPAIVGTAALATVIVAVAYVPRCTGWVATIEEFVRAASALTGCSEQVSRARVFDSRGVVFQTTFLSHYMIGLVTLGVLLAFFMPVVTWYDNVQSLEENASEARAWLEDIERDPSPSEADRAKWSEAFTASVQESEAFAESLRRQLAASVGVGLLATVALGLFIYRGRRKRGVGKLIRAASRTPEGRGGLLDQAALAALESGQLRMCADTVEPSFRAGNKER